MDTSTACFTHHVLFVQHRNVAQARSIVASLHAAGTQFGLTMNAKACNPLACVWHAGYMVARVLGAAPVLADAIIDQLAAPSDKATDAGM